jgi:glucokinase
MAKGVGRPWLAPDRAGLSDFRLKLAAGLAATIPVSHTLVRRTGTSLELGAKVLNNTSSALLRLGDELNPAALESAIERLDQARRIDFFAVGSYSPVAQGAHFKFLRFGVPCVAVVDERLQAITAESLGAGDVVVVASGSGRIAELARAVQVAADGGAFVIAVCPSGSPLARHASLSIAIDHLEDVDTQMPMVSRILTLAVVDVLAVGVAMRHSVAAQDGRGAPAAKLSRGRGRTRSGLKDFAQITSHSR